uniref:Uncharacterized protein n=1 Tax=Panagrolaimus davidi TaxID=227884 RepID=A0A914RC45_9BILA
MVSAETLTSPDSENAQNDFQSRCSDILKEAGATSQFGGITGHAIHSISVRVLKKFKHNVTENNRVPTINMNLTSDQPILPYAPDRSTPDSKHFHTDGMKILDEVLTHMDDSSYDVKNLSPLEKIAHAFHMEEMWVAALHAYRKLKQDPPSEEVCNCAMDIDNNGILKQLRFAALGIREPQLVYQDKLQRFKRQLSYHITYSKSFKKRSIPE